MENVVLIIHLILALALIGIVLLQRSEGGMGGLGGGSGGGLISARGAATALGKLTWWLAGAFIVTSIALTIIAAQKSANSSVLDRLSDRPAAEQPATAPAPTDPLLPPPANDGPATPRAD